jgi:hypothetical protein
MARTHRFRPGVGCELEDRVVLHTAPRGPAVLVSGLYPQTRALTRATQPVVALVNQAFDLFVNDYTQARGLYFASINGSADMATATAAKMAFTSYTTQRVSNLAQQLTSSFLSTPQGTSRARKQPVSITQLIGRRIIGPNGGMTGTLADALISAIPAPGTAASTATLYSLSQDSAIEAARTAILNGVTILRNQDFGNQTQSHK